MLLGTLRPTAAHLAQHPGPTETRARAPHHILCAQHGTASRKVDRRDEEQIVEVVNVIVQQHVSLRIVEKIMRVLVPLTFNWCFRSAAINFVEEEFVHVTMPQDVPQVVGERVDMVQTIVQEHFEHVDDQIGDVTVPQSLEEIFSWWNST